MAWLAIILGFLDIFCMGLLIPIGGVYVQKLGGSRFHIGLLTSMHSLLQLITGPVVGSWSDSKGRKPLIYMTIILLTISNLLIAVPSLPIYVLSRVFFGIAVIQILVKAVISDTTPREKQAEVFGRMGALLALGFIVAPIMSGHIFEKENGMTILSTTLLTINVLMFGTAFLLKEKPSKKAAKVKSKPKGISQEVTSIFTNLASINWKVYGTLFSIKFLTETANSAFFSTFGLIILEVFGRTHKEMGYVIAWFSLIMVIGNVMIGKIKNKVYADDAEGYKRNVHGLTLLTASFFTMYIVPSFTTYIVMIVPMAMARVLLENTWMDMLLSKTNEAEKGTVMGAFESVLQLAGLGTPILTGIVGDMYGYTTALGLAVVPMLTATFLAAYMTIHHNKEKTK